MMAGIQVQHLSKRFRKADPSRAWTLQEMALRGFRGLWSREWFWALKDVSLDVSPGQMVGVIGRNGAGKSTLLNLAGGVGAPDSGKIQTQGRVAALIDLGAGFHPDLTGRENTRINGIVAGLTRDEVERRFDAIVAFAELSDFIDSPLRTYSTGMQMRLAFSVATHVDPQVLLIDEVLAVGDLAFQQKCLERIDQFKRQGCAILLVSHDMSVIRRLCDEVVWLEAGRVARQGPASEVVESYVRAMEMETRRRTPPGRQPVPLPHGGELRLQENRIGSLEVEIQSVGLYDRTGNPVATLLSGECLRVEIGYNASAPVEPVFGVTITNADRLVIFEASAACASLGKPTVQGKGSLSLQIERLDLAPGKYFVDVGIYKGDWEYAYDYHWQAYPLDVAAEGAVKGLLAPPYRWEMD